KGKKISASKRLFHETFGDKEYLPKTVFTLEEAKTLKYPIIAKPAFGHSGIGITKFNSYKELESEVIKNGLKFDVFSEAIQIDKEFRIIFLKDKIVALAVRIPNDEKTKF